MHKKLSFLGIIPARYASTRFPGKPLVDIGGKTMIQRVYEQASQSLSEVYIATDDARIEKAVSDFNGKVIMTSDLHKSGTDRCSEALIKIVQKTGHNFDVVVNIQGDEPFIQPEQINKLIQCFDDPATDIATLVMVVKDSKDLFNPNHVKVVLNKSKKALYFSRSIIPYIRNIEQDKWAESYNYLKHIGIYAYKSSVLKEITNLSSSSLEMAESLEQNRWLENGYTIRTELTEYESYSIDSPEDLENVKKKFL